MEWRPKGAVANWVLKPFSTRISLTGASRSVSTRSDTTAVGQESPLRYRADIDGLRALSVIVVVFYHAGVPLVGGGYVGVDVFFVISGFLITSLILQE